MFQRSAAGMAGELSLPSSAALLQPAAAIEPSGASFTGGISACAARLRLAERLRPLGERALPLFERARAPLACASATPPLSLTRARPGRGSATEGSTAAGAGSRPAFLRGGMLLMVPADAGLEALWLCATQIANASRFGEESGVSPTACYCYKPSASKFYGVPSLSSPAGGWLAAAPSGSPSLALNSSTASVAACRQASSSPKTLLQRAGIAGIAPVARRQAQQ